MQHIEKNDNPNVDREREGMRRAQQKKEKKKNRRRGRRWEQTTEGHSGMTACNYSLWSNITTKRIPHPPNTQPPGPRPVIACAVKPPPPLQPPPPPPSSPLHPPTHAPTPARACLCLPLQPRCNAATETPSGVKQVVVHLPVVQTLPEAP
jgi:hypothetical protein